MKSLCLKCPPLSPTQSWMSKLYLSFSGDIRAASQFFLFDLPWHSLNTAHDTFLTQVMTNMLTETQRPVSHCKRDHALYAPLHPRAASQSRCCYYCHLTEADTASKRSSSKETVWLRPEPRLSGPGDPSFISTVRQNEQPAGRVFHIALSSRVAPGPLEMWLMGRRTDFKFI